MEFSYCKLYLNGFKMAHNTQASKESTILSFAH